MTPEQIDRLIEMIVTIGGAAAEQGFAIAVRRVMFLAYVQIGWATLFALAAVGLSVTGVLLWKKHRKEQEEQVGYYDDEWALATCGAYAVSALTVIAAIDLFVRSLDRFVNPEWHAVMMLLDLIK